MFYFLLLSRFSLPLLKHFTFSWSPFKLFFKKKKGRTTCKVRAMLVRFSSLSFFLPCSFFFSFFPLALPPCSLQELEDYAWLDSATTREQLRDSARGTTAKVVATCSKAGRKERRKGEK
jgi:hypothetical protein